MRLTLIAAFAAEILFCTSSSAEAQEATKLSPGFTLERSLAPSENHVYTISLEQGAAVLGEADQHGVDLVIDEYGPDSKLLRTVDSPNGTEGPEPIDLTAFASGQYKLVIHTLDAAAKPGKYVIKIDRVVSAEENGARIAEKNYPPALQTLWKEYVNDPKAMFFGTELVPKDSRYRYGYSVTETSFLGPKGTIQISEEREVMGRP
jgi:hypothetical protein